MQMCIRDRRSVGVVLATSTFKAGVQEAVRRAATHIIGFFIKLELKFFRLSLIHISTGQGKSVGLNAIITSLLYRKHPAQLKFVMIDPKMVEFSLYAKIERHFLAKMESEDDAIVTDPRKAVYALNSLCTETVSYTHLNFA